MSSKKKKKTLSTSEYDAMVNARLLDSIDTVHTKKLTKVEYDRLVNTRVFGRGVGVTGNGYVGDAIPHGAGRRKSLTGGRVSRRTSKQQEEKHETTKQQEEEEEQQQKQNEREQPSRPLAATNRHRKQQRDESEEEDDEGETVPAAAATSSKSSSFTSPPSNRGRPSSSSTATSAAVSRSVTTSSALSSSFSQEQFEPEPQPRQRLNQHHRQQSPLTLLPPVSSYPSVPSSSAFPSRSLSSSSSAFSFPTPPPNSLEFMLEHCYPIEARPSISAAPTSFLRASLDDLILTPELQSKLQRSPGRQMMPGVIVHTDCRVTKDYEHDPSTPLKLIQWNIERGYKLPEIISLLREEHADIISLQEIDIGCARSQWIDTGLEIARALKMNMTYVTEFIEIYSPLRPENGQGGGVHGHAILSRFDHTNARTILHNPGYDWLNDGHLKREPRVGERYTLVVDVVVKEQRRMEVDAGSNADINHQHATLNGSASAIPASPSRTMPHQNSIASASPTSASTTTLNAPIASSPIFSSTPASTPRFIIDRLIALIPEEQRAAAYATIQENEAAAAGGGSGAASPMNGAVAGGGAATLPLSLDSNLVSPLNGIAPAAAYSTTSSGPTTKILTLYNSHFEVFAGLAARQQYFEDIVQHVEADLKQAAAAAASSSPPNFSKHKYHAILGDFNTLGHGIARFSPSYCRDRYRFLSLGWTEAEYFTHHVLHDYANRNRLGFICPFDAYSDVTLVNYSGWFQGKLDWMLLRNLTAVKHYLRNNLDYEASDHAMLVCEVTMDPPPQQIDVSLLGLGKKQRASGGGGGSHNSTPTHAASLSSSSSTSLSKPFHGKTLFELRRRMPLRRPSPGLITSSTHPSIYLPQVIAFWIVVWTVCWWIVMEGENMKQ